MGKPFNPTLPRLAILGNGRAGKDTAGMWLHLHTDLKYVGSTSMVVCPTIANYMSIPPTQAWDERHQNRMFWWEWCNNYRIDDPSKLAKLVLQTGNMVVGLRDLIEFNTCLKDNLFELAIWIHRDVPNDPTVTFSRSDCDIVIDNTGEPSTFFRRLARLSQILLAKDPKTCSYCSNPITCTKALEELKKWSDVESFLSCNNK